MVSESVEPALREDIQVEISGITFYEIVCLATHRVQKYKCYFNLNFRLNSVSVPPHQPLVIGVGFLFMEHRAEVSEKHQSMM